MTNDFDILIAGSGFAGSLAALMLHERGFRVCLVEKGQHPRFAIGESSTPIADMVLRDISTKYNLPWLHDFSRYGSWQRAHPEVVCGLKRGFSYYKHFPGQPFSTNDEHANELLVAASSSDDRSDTNWLRSDIDAFLVNRVKEYAIPYLDLTELISCRREKANWIFEAKQSGQSLDLSAAFFIDATGGGQLLERFFSVRSSSADFLTDSFAVFSHLEGLPEWMDILKQKSISSADYPYNPDHSALHYLLDEGWIWALRFNNGRTSWGFALNGALTAFEQLKPEAIWDFMRKRYPDIDGLLRQASFSVEPGAILRSQRLQRKAAKVAGPGWVALPHTGGFIDPLFSTGIAHSLTGLEKVVEAIVLDFKQPLALQARLEEYERQVFEELKLVDLLVSGCYKTMAHFPLFNAWSMLYFAFTIQYEQRRLKKLPVETLLCAGDKTVQAIAQDAYRNLLKILAAPSITPEQVHGFADYIREKIRPYNIAGLLDPGAKNMYWHTTAELDTP